MNYVQRKAGPDWCEFHIRVLVVYIDIALQAICGHITSALLTLDVHRICFECSEPRYYRLGYQRYANPRSSTQTSTSNMLQLPTVLSWPPKRSPHLLLPTKAPSPRSATSPPILEPCILAWDLTTEFLSTEHEKCHTRATSESTMNTRPLGYWCRMSPELCKRLRNLQVSDLTV